MVREEIWETYKDTIGINPSSIWITKKLHPYPEILNRITNTNRSEGHKRSHHESLVVLHLILHTNLQWRQRDWNGMTPDWKHQTDLGTWRSASHTPRDATIAATHAYSPPTKRNQPQHIQLKPKQSNDISKPATSRRVPLHFIAPQWISP